MTRRFQFSLRGMLWLTAAAGLILANLLHPTPYAMHAAIIALVVWLTPKLARSVMRRPQFTLRALLVAMLATACFFAGAAWQKRRMDADMDRIEKVFQEALEKSGRQKTSMIDADTMVTDMISPRSITVIPDDSPTAEKSGGDEQPDSP